MFFKKFPSTCKMLIGQYDADLYGGLFSFKIRIITAKF